LDVKSTAAITARQTAVDRNTRRRREITKRTIDRKLLETCRSANPKDAVVLAAGSVQDG